LLDVLTFAKDEGFAVKSLIRSPITGPKGNVEFLAWLGTGTPPAKEEQLSTWIDAVAPLEDSPQEDR
jgi:hypothetical protein